MNISALKYIIYVFAGILALTIAADIWIYFHIPHSPDLYNDIYGNYRPNKPENTFLFIFGFPAVNLFFLIVLIFNFILVPPPKYKITERDAIKLSIAFAISFLFLAGSIYRIERLLSHYNLL